MSATAHAAPFTIADTYVGSDGHGKGDVIGHTSKYQINDMVVELMGDDLIVTISTNMDAGLGTAASKTLTALSEGKGIGWGDLFISVDGWDPFGPAPYWDDDNTNGEKWEYGVALDDRWDASSSTAALYALNGATNDDNAYLSEDFMSAGLFRNGQEAAVDTSVGDTEWKKAVDDVAMTGGDIKFTIDTVDTSLHGKTVGELGFHWAITCGNDTIEGMPEPTTVAMLILGVACIGFAQVRRRKMVRS